MLTSSSGTSINEEQHALIEYFQENIEFIISHEEVITSWLKSVIEQEQGKLRHVNYIFCSDEYLYHINVEYLNHDTYTDVITFPYSETYIEGDIFISIDRIKDNAATLQVLFTQELHRVLVHGMLHLLGYFDKTPAEKQQMTAKEDYYLKQLSNSLS